MRTGFSGFQKIVDKNRQTGDVIHMRVGHDDVAHFLALFSSQRQRDAAGVNGNTLVYEKACQTLF